MGAGQQLVNSWSTVGQHLSAAWGGRLPLRSDNSSLLGCMNCPGRRATQEKITAATSSCRCIPAAAAANRMHTAATLLTKVCCCSTSCSRSHCQKDPQIHRPPHCTSQRTPRHNSLHSAAASSAPVCRHLMQPHQTAQRDSWHLSRRC